MNQKEVFFIADDFGRADAVNRAIIESHRRGALHGASLMMGQPATTEAVALARQHPTLQVGWHLHLCGSQPVTCPAWPWGKSPVVTGLCLGLMSALMRRELATQWKMFQSTGLPCAFINSHHHLHAHPLVYRRLLEVVPATFAGWLRMGRVCSFNGDRGNFWDGWWERRRRRCPWPVSDTLWGVDRLRRMNAAEIRRVIETLDVGRHEFMFHPEMAGDADFVALQELR